MKKITTLCAVLFLIITVTEAQTLQSLFQKYADDERFEYVSVGKGMMNFASSLGGIAKNDKAMMSKMRGIKILSLTSKEDASLMKSFTKDVNDVLENGNFEVAVEARDKGERVQIFYRISGTDNADMLIITKEKGEFNIIWMTGKMSKDEMINSFSSNGNSIQIHSNITKKTDTIS